MPPLEPSDDALQALGRSVAGVAHDIDNALTAIVSHASLIRARSNEAESVAHAEAILKSVRIASQVVERVRAALRPASPTPPARVRVDLVALVAEALATASVRAAARGVALIPPEVATLASPAWVAGLPGELHQALVNLVHNAIDAATARVAVSLRVAGPEGRVAILDDGPGIPESLRERIFQPFFTTRPDGTGLGLSLAHSIIEAHGGALALEPAHPGTRATVTLPLLAADEAPELPLARPLTDLELDASQGGGRVLIIDDEAATREALRVLFEASGHHVETAATANQALAAMHGFNPDLVVTDLQLGPSRPGVHLDRLFAIDPTVPVLVMTGLTHDQRPPNLARRVAAIHDKPISPSRLLDAARLLVAERIAFRQTRRGRP